MTRRALSWGSTALLVVLMAGCASDADASRDGSKDDAAKPTTTTSTPATTTTTVPPPYSFDGSVPPPPLVNTGTDYAAIYASLTSYAAWLKAHNPDPELVADAMVRGSALHERVASDLRLLRDSNLRLVEVESAPHVTVATETDTAVGLAVTENITAEQLIEPSGATRDEKVYSSPPHWTALLQADQQGRWRLASIEPAE
jgi:hypothetical protein